MLKKFLIFLLFTISAITATGQSLSFEFLKTEIRLKELFTALYKTENDKSSDSLNSLILEAFSKELQIPESFYYSWSSLDMIGKLHSPDKKLNLYSWYVKSAKGTYVYYGYIQYNNGSQKRPNIKFYSLKDQSKGMKNPETLTLTPDNWLGCVYFNTYTFQNKRDDYYLLLGYNFNNEFSDKKYIEVLTFNKEGVPVFGGDFHTEFQDVRRVIMEYSSQLVAGIKYDEKLQMIVCDHLAPLEEMFTGNYRFYGPDGSYDGYRFHKGVFELQKDVDARNDAPKDKPAKSLKTK